MIKQQKEKIFFFQKRRESANYVIIFFPPFPEYVKSRHNSPRSVLHLDRRGWRVVATVRSPLRRAGSRRARRSRPSAVRSRRLPVRFQSNPIRCEFAPRRAERGKDASREASGGERRRSDSRSGPVPARHVISLACPRSHGEPSRVEQLRGLGWVLGSRAKSRESDPSRVEPRQSSVRANRSRDAPRRAVPERTNRGRTDARWGTRQRCIERQQR